jgi:hypothetical protein
MIGKNFKKYISKISIHSNKSSFFKIHSLNQTRNKAILTLKNPVDIIVFLFSKTCKNPTKSIRFSSFKIFENKLQINIISYIKNLIANFILKPFFNIITSQITFFYRKFIKLNLPLNFFKKILILKFILFTIIFDIFYSTKSIIL